MATRGHCRFPAESYNDRLIGHACGNRTIEDTGNNDSAPIRRPASAPAFRANEHRAERGGGHWTGPCGRCTRPACSAIRDPFPAIGRKREIGKSPAENCTPRTKGVIATIDRVSLPYIPPMDSRLFSFFLWNWNYWKLIIAWFSWEVSGV